MKHPERVADYLEHIVVASSRALDYVRDADNFEDFMRDTRTQDAVVRNIEIIGEAVTQLEKADPDFTTAHPNIHDTRSRTTRARLHHQALTRMYRATIVSRLSPVRRAVRFLHTLARAGC